MAFHVDDDCLNTFWGAWMYINREKESERDIVSMWTQTLQNLNKCISLTSTEGDINNFL